MDIIPETFIIKFDIRFDWKVIPFSGNAAKFNDLQLLLTVKENEEIIINEDGKNSHISRII